MANVVKLFYYWLVYFSRTAEMIGGLFNDQSQTSCQVVLSLLGTEEILITIFRIFV